MPAKSQLAPNSLFYAVIKKPSRKFAPHNYGKKPGKRPALFACMLKAAIVVGILLIIVSCGEDKKPEVTDLKCEYVKEPTGIDMKKPRFSWIIKSPARNASQSAYRILVGKSREALQNESGNVWNSRKISSKSSVNIKYSGNKLQSSKTYYWKVKVWDQTGKASQWSEPVSFTTGIQNNPDWQAEWISARDSSVSAPLFRKEFDISGKISEAIVHVTGVGYYQFYFNGDTVGDQVLAPAMTDYRKRVMYKTFDVTDRINAGTNVLGFVAGNGPYRMTNPENRYSWGGRSNIMGIPACLLQLHIRFKDGSEKIITSDESWKYSSGPVTFNHFYGGEDYDARKEKSGWSSSEYDVSDWKNVTVTEGPQGKLDASIMAPLQVTQTIQPVTKTQSESGVYLFDLGQNIPGWWQIKVEGQKGTTVRIRGAETLNDSLFPNPLTSGDTLSTKHDYHKNVWTTYTLDGQGTEIYEPAFFYTGFRYIEVKPENPEKIESLSVAGRVVRSGLKRNGTFSSSDTLLNQIHRATIWSQKGNMHGFPTDCPQREKGGYTGDGQVIAQTSMHDFHTAAFYTKWLNDMRDAQQDNGRIPNTSPTLVGGHGGGIGWGSAYVLIPWWMYQYYNDTRVLENHYSSMKDYVTYLRNLARTDANPDEPHIINDFGGYWDSLGEWRAPGEADGPNHPVVNTYYFYKDATLFSKIAEKLGHTEDAQEYKALADTIKDAFNRKFFNADTYLYGTDTVYQTYQLVGLEGDLVPNKARKKVLQTIIRDITEKRNGHLNTGIIGTKHLWHVLSQAGKADVAYSTVQQTTYPSYGYWLQNGASTLWELWSGEKSHNHQMFGTVNEFFYQYLAGIRAPVHGKTTRAYEHIRIKPFIPEDLDSVSASLETMRGEVVSKWHKNAGNFDMQVTIPANSTGSISVPTLDMETVTIREQDKKIWENGSFNQAMSGILDGKKQDQYITFSVGSGTYHFTVSGE